MPNLPGSPRGTPKRLRRGTLGMMAFWPRVIKTGLMVSSNRGSLCKPTPPSSSTPTNRSVAPCSDAQQESELPARSGHLGELLQPALQGPGRDPRGSPGQQLLRNAGLLMLPVATDCPAHRCPTMLMANPPAPYHLEQHRFKRNCTACVCSERASECRAE
jgi:hypothetical protein